MREENLLKEGFSASVYNFAGKLLSSIFIFLTSIFIIKFLSVEEYGIYNIFNTILMVTLTFHLGIPKILNRYYPEFYEKKEWILLRKLTFWSLALRLLMGVIFAVVLVVFSKIFVTTFKFPSTMSHLLLIIGVLIIVKIESRVLENFMISLLDYYYNSLFTFIYAVLRFFSFYYLLIRGYGIIGIIWAWLAVEVVLFFLYIIRNAHLLTPFFSRIKKEKECTERLPVKRLARYGGFYFLGGVGGYVLEYPIDNFFISGYMDNVWVGLYSFGARVVTLASQINPVTYLLDIISTILIRKYIKTKDRNILLYAFQLYNKLTVFFGFPMFAGLCVLADKIILHLFNRPEYLKALPVVWSWAVISSFVALGTVVIPFIRVLERAEIMTVYIIFAAINIGLDIILIPKFGINGALLATGSVQILTFFFQLFMLRHYLSVKYPWAALLRIGLNIAAMCFVVFLLRNSIQSFMALILVAVIGALFYLGISYLNRGFSQKDRDLLNDAIGKKLFVF